MSDAFARLIVAIEANTATLETGMAKAAASTDAAMKGIKSAVSAAKSAVVDLVASVVTVGAVIKSVRDAIDLGDTLKTMSDATGIAVEKLDQLALIAAQNGAELGDMAKGFKFLNSSMIEAQDGASKSGQLFSTLGVNVKDAAGNLRGVDEVMGDVADALGGIENETLRAAVGTELFGKSYAQIAAALRNYREDQEKANAVIEKYGGVSKLAAQLSDDLGDKIMLLGEGSKRALLNGLVPGLAAVGAGLDELTKKGGAFQTGFGDVLSRVANFTMQSLISLGGAFEVVGTSIAAVFAAISTRSLQPLRELPGQIDAINARVEASQARVGEAFSDAADGTAELRRQLDDLNKSTNTSNASQDKAAQLAKILAGGHKATKEAVDKLLESLKSLESAQTKALQTTQKMSEQRKAETAIIEAAQQKYGAWVDTIEEALRVMTAEQAAVARAVIYKAAVRDAENDITETLKLSIAAAEERNKEWDKEFEAVERDRVAKEGAIKTIRESVEQQEFEVRIMGLSSDERIKAIMLREAEKGKIDSTTESYKALIARMQEAANTKAVSEAQVKLWNDIEGAAHDAFLHIFEGGRSVFERLTQTLKSTLLELLYQMTLKKWVLSIGAAITGNAGIANAAANAGGGAFDPSSLLSGANALSNLWSTGTLLGNVAGAASLGLSGITTFGGSAFAASANGAGIGFGIANGVVPASLVGTTEVGGSILAGLQAGLAAVPVWGWAALAAVVIGGIILGMDEGPAMRTATFGNNVQMNPDFQGRSAFGTFGVVQGTDQWFSVADQGKEFKAFADAITGVDNAIAGLVDKDMTGKITAALTAQQTRFEAGIEHQATSFGDIMVQRYGTVIATIDSRLSPAFAKFRGTGEELAKFTIGLVALDQVLLKLPESIQSKLIPALDGTQATLDKVTAVAMAMYDVGELMKRDPMADAITAIAAANTTAYTSFMDSATALRAQIDANDDSIAGLQALTAATTNYYAAGVQLLAQINQVTAAISEMFAGTTRGFRYDILDNQGKYEFLQSENANLLAQALAATDPEQINRLATQINQNTQAMWGLMSPENRAGQIESITTYAETQSNLITQHLTDLGTTVGQSIQETMADVGQKLDDIADKMGAAADKQVSAADTQLQAANIPVTVTVRQIAPVASEVGGS